MASLDIDSISVGRDEWTSHFSADERSRQIEDDLNAGKSVVAVLVVVVTLGALIMAVSVWMVA